MHPAWAAIAVGLVLNGIGLAYNYGRNSTLNAVMQEQVKHASALSAVRDLIEENERRIDRVQADIREIRVALMAKGAGND